MLHIAYIAIVLGQLYCVLSMGIANNVYCVNESTIVYGLGGQPSIVGTLVNCLRNVQDGLTSPYYSTGKRINVSTEVFLNNLISVNEVSNTVSLDIFFSTNWVSTSSCFYHFWRLY